MAMFRVPKTYTEEEINNLTQYISINNNANNVTFIEQTNYHVKFQGTRENQLIVFSFSKDDNLVIEETE